MARGPVGHECNRLLQPLEFPVLVRRLTFSGGHGSPPRVADLWNLGYRGFKKSKGRRRL